MNNFERSFILVCFLLNWQDLDAATKRFLSGRGFARGVIQGIVTEHDIDEASGCAASRTHPGILYTLNDHGGENRVFALATNGTLLAKYTIDGAKNVDWEDIAVGPCSNSNNAPDCIYIADTGDSGSDNTIYRVEEPYFVGDSHVTVQSRLKFSWSEPDCETLMVDPQANVYLISKVSDGRGALYYLPNSAWGTGHRVHVDSAADVSAPSTHKDPVGGDISPDGNGVLVKVHEGIYYWDMNGSRDYQAVIASAGQSIPYIQENKGESICWDYKGSGFYTMSEGRNEPIYYYARV